ncbi:hypothetical protein [Aminobacter carboxidus]|uniref:Uncharacterized protein n=1 Tax=Aminobacter carboxidus TaxID=376165 RepID=A0ABR9GHJ0_9HYPH|nr:hypothetical protein [Aminobacter carboxidus]MBE1203146.1 hypothetical protein [Aminobacter carboxidus]
MSRLAGLPRAELLRERAARRAEVAAISAELDQLEAELKLRKAELQSAGLWLAADGTIFVIGIIASPLTGGLSLAIAAYELLRLGMGGLDAARISGPVREVQSRILGCTLKLEQAGREIGQIDLELARRPKS